MDTVSRSERARIMARVRSRDTSPELVVRRLVHALGFRFRLHVRALPGTPDIVLPRRRKIIDVRGCFWHGHGCGRCRIPAAHRAYWTAKIDRNRARDRRTTSQLRRLGWHVLVVWECRTVDRELLRRAVERFLAS